MASVGLHCQGWLMAEETVSSSPSPFSLLLKLTISVHAFFTLLKPIYITVFDAYSLCFLCAETWKLAHAQRIMKVIG